MPDFLDDDLGDGLGDDLLSTPESAGSPPPAYFAPGAYRICYVLGAYQYDPRGYSNGRGYTVNSDFAVMDPAYEGRPGGFYVTDGKGNTVPAPGNPNLYASQAACQSGNAGSTIIYQHNGGNIGIFLSDFPLWDNLPGSPSPTFTIAGPGPSISLTATPEGPNIQGTSVVLSWDVGNSPTSISIDQGIGAVAASGSTTVNPTVNTTYTLTAVGTATIETTASVTVYVGSPSPVQYLQAEGTCSGGVVLSWGASQFANEYKIERSPTLAEAWATIITLSGTVYIDAPPSAFDLYDYRVTVMDGLTWSEPQVVVGAIAGGIPSAPTNLVAVPLNQRVALSADVCVGATSYSVYRGFSSGAETLLATGLPGPAYIDANLVDGAPVYYKMTASSTCGESAMSAEVSAIPRASLQTYGSMQRPSNGWR